MNLLTWICRTSFSCRLVCAILLWLSLIACFLFSPYITRGFRSDNELRILIWPMMLDAKMLTQFEEETGIKVHISYFESNEELLYKLRIGKGKGYDLIMSVDYAIETLAHEGFLKKLDHTQLNFFTDLNPLLMGHYYDPHNNYSLPYFVSIYGLGIDKEFFGSDMPEASWSLLFDPANRGYKVTMSDDPRRSIMIAGKYLYGSINNVTQPDHLQAIKELLIAQKPRVEIYTDIRGEDLLASRTCPVALLTSPDFWRLKKEFPHVEFLFPKDGSFIAIDSFAMPATTKKEEMVYKLLNFIYRPDVLDYYISRYGFCPPIKNIPVEQYDLMCADEKTLRNVEFFKNSIPKEQIDSIWLSVMVS